MASRNDAIAEALKFYSAADSGDENMKKNYQNAAARIKKMAARFKEAEPRPEVAGSGDAGLP